MSWLMHQVVSRIVTTSCYNCINHFFMRNFASSILRLFLMAIFPPWWQKPTLEDQIIVAQRRSQGVRRIKENIASGVAKCFSTDSKGTVFFENRLVVPKNKNLRQLILKE